MRVGGMLVREEYISGWNGTAMINFPTDDKLSIGNVLGAALASNIVPGEPVMLCLELASGSPDVKGTVVRSWPSMVSRIEPFEYGDDAENATCAVNLLDPVSYLSGRTIWGAYRAQSIGEMIGGALSLAAGGNGKPTLHPVLPGLPKLEIVEDFRDYLNQVPYSIATGQTLGEWLRHVLGLLGLRMEMIGQGDGLVRVKLSDRKPSEEKLMKMSIEGIEPEPEPAGQGEEVVARGNPTRPGPERPWSEPEPEPAARKPKRGEAGELKIVGYAGYPGLKHRGGVLDDPAEGSFRYMAPVGGMRKLVSGPAVGVEEASWRNYYPVQGAYVESVLISVESIQPNFRPGRLVELDTIPVGTEKRWQLARVAHSLAGDEYTNDATLIRGDHSWHPPQLPEREPVLVSGVVHGGADVSANTPVPRDRLGHVPVMLSFLPDFGDEEAPGAGPSSNLSGIMSSSPNPTPPPPSAPGPSPGGAPADDDDDDEDDPANDGVIDERDLDASVIAKADQAAEAAVEAQRWPPRIPLTVIEPMAGGLHGFISAHRHGDACRVAVHTPFYAEIVGFQYRNDRKIGDEITGAITGMVVDHDSVDAWSGLVFRRAEHLEEETPAPPSANPSHRYGQDPGGRFSS